LDIISFLTKKPQLLLINSHIQRDEGLLKSLANDEIINNIKDI